MIFDYFLSQNFMIRYLKQYPRKEIYNLYTLTKELNPTYNDDPLSFENMVEWVLRFKYNFDNVYKKEFKENSDDIHSSYQRFRFELKSFKLNRKYRINGEALVCNVIDKKAFKNDKNKVDHINKLFQVSDSPSHLRFLFCPITDVNIENQNWITIYGKNVSQILRSHNLRSVPFGQRDVGGAIFYLTQLEEVFFSRNDKLFGPSQGQVILYLTDSHVSQLKQGDFVFFCRRGLTGPILMGRSEVIALTSDTIFNLEGKYDNERSTSPVILDLEQQGFHDPYERKDWQIATNFIQAGDGNARANKRIWILGMDRIEKPKDEATAHVFTPLLTKDVLSYVMSEFDDSFTSSTYLDIKSTEKINDSCFNNGSGPRLALV